MKKSSRTNEQGDGSVEAASNAGGAMPDAPASLPDDFFALNDDEIAARHPSIGTYLAGQRKLRGISRKELCERTRIPLRSLERLEDGRFDDVDDGFVRGFVRTVSEGLGIDPDDAVARMVLEPEVESHRERVGRSVVRAGIALSGLVLLLLSAGLISMVIELGPVESKTHVVLRRDPVRTLAKAEGLWGLPETALWVPIRRGVLAPGNDTPSGEVMGVSRPEIRDGEVSASPRPASLRDSLPSPAAAEPAPATARADELE